jgi:hypothetical protein
LVVTFALVTGVSAGIYYFLVTRGAVIEFIIFGLCLTSVVLISLTLLAFVDPGIVQG